MKVEEQRLDVPDAGGELRSDLMAAQGFSLENSIPSILIGNQYLRPRNFV